MCCIVSPFLEALVLPVKIFGLCMHDANKIHHSWFKSDLISTKVLTFVMNTSADYEFQSETERDSERLGSDHVFVCFPSIVFFHIFAS